MATIRDLGLMAAAVYEDVPAVPGWICPNHLQASSGWNGFQAATFTQGGVTVIVFRGTSLAADAAADLAADLRLGVGMNTSYFSDGEDYAASAAAPGDGVYVCGHSLGGAIAQVVANRGGYKMVTFNAPGVAVFASRNVEDIASSTPWMQAIRVGGALVSTVTNPIQTFRDVRSTFHTVQGLNIRLSYDAVSQIGIHYGEMVTLEGPTMNPLTAHGIDTVNGVLATNPLGGRSVSSL
jgi:pimeloyl-ACP methyl ester carboxylesterase